MTAALTALSALMSFPIIWNIPSQPCSSKYQIEFNVSSHWIVQNEDRQFVGDRIALLYSVGSFPALIPSGNPGQFLAVNGGVPQNGNLEAHIEKLRSDLTEKLSNDFAGVGVIDFEGWRADFDQNFDSLKRYQEFSRDLVTRMHPDWETALVESKARDDFNAGAKLFFEATLKELSAYAPNAMWGFYHYPYCFWKPQNQPACSEAAAQGNDRMQWLFNESSVLLPSLYVDQNGTSVSERARKVHAVLSETARVNLKSKPLMPYINVAFEDGGFLTEEDVLNTIGLAYDAGAAGVVLWGSSSLVQDEPKCRALKDFVDGPLGRVADYFHELLSRCSKLFCGNLYRCQSRKRGSQQLVSRVKRLGNIMSLNSGNKGLAKQLFRKEYRCVPSWKYNDHMFTF